MKNLPGLGFDPPRVVVSPEVDWLLLRAFQESGPIQPFSEKLDGKVAVDLGKTLALLMRARSKTSRKSVEFDLGGSAADLIDRMRHQVTASSMRHEEVCHQIAEVAREPRIPVIFLKGMTLQLTGVTQPGGRDIADIDILVPEHSAENLQQMLLDTGGEPSGLRGSDQHLSVLTHALGAPIEIHHHLRGVDLGMTAPATAEQCLERGLVDPAGGFADYCYVTSERLTVAHLLVHALSLHGRAPKMYPAFQFLGDLQDLGYSPVGGKQIPEESLQWISNDVSPNLVDAAMALLARLARGERASGIASGSDGSATFLRHLLAGGLDEQYQRSLKISNEMQAAVGMQGSHWSTQIWRALWLTPGQIDILYGKPRTRLGYLGWRIWRPFHLAGKTVSSAGAWLKIRRRLR